MPWFRKSRPTPKPSAPAVERLEARDQPAAVPLADLNPTPAAAFHAFHGPHLGGPVDAPALGGAVYFGADDGTHGAAVWKSDGTAAGTKLVADLPDRNGYGPTTPPGQPANFVAAAGKVFFTFDDGAAGNELWVTDGTAGGTTVVRDLNPGRSGGSPFFLTAAGGKLVFVARTSDAVPGFGSVFATDGTSAGTVPLKDLGPTYSTTFAATGGKLYFSQQHSHASTGTVRTELWVSDGTKAGTKAVAALPDNVRVDGSVGPWAVAVGSKVYFAAVDPAAGRELWVTDGTPAGTKLVKDVNTTPARLEASPPGSEASTANANPHHLTAIGGVVYFVADDGLTGHELWRTDGTATGTEMVADLTPGPESYPTNPYGNWPTGSGITGLTAAGGRLYFGADAGESGPQFYVSDGTAAGTAALTSVAHTPTDTFPTNPYGYFPSEAPAVLSADPGRVLFTLADGVNGRQLWATDGTKAGTKLTRLIPRPPGPFSAGAVPLGAVGGKLLFHDDDGPGGRQLFATDGTAAGTGVVTRINPTNLGSHPGGFVVAGKLAYFIAGTGPGTGVYATDGTAAPRLVKAFDAGPGDQPARLVASGGGVYILGRVGGFGTRLYRTDGTPAGTTVVKDLDAPADGSAFFGPPIGIGNPTDVNGTLFFTVDATAAGQQLWKTDGTAKGTVLVRQINDRSSQYVPGFPPPFPGEPGPGPIRQLTAAGGKLYFTAADEPTGEELWVSNGTETGTRRVADVNPGYGGSAPDDLTALGGKVYFTAFDGGATGRQLWATDGTEKGTAQVAAIAPPAFTDPAPPVVWGWGPESRDMVAAGGKLYLTGWDDVHGSQLWVSDGTAKGTRRVSALAGAWSVVGVPPDPLLGGLTAAGAKVVFTAQDAKLGRQLYVSDGTPTGTKILGPIGDGTQGGGSPYSLPQGAAPAVLAVDGTTVYFAADDGARGYELWRTDGTTAGTKLVREFVPGPAGGLGTVLTGIRITAPAAAVVNGRLVLGADAGTGGSEPWAVTLSDAPPPPPTPGPTGAALVAAMRAAATEETAFTARLAAVSLPPATDYKVTLLWGDGRSSVGTLTRNTPTGKTYTVSGGHTYADPGTYKVRVTITRAGKTVLSFDTGATVADARFYAGRVAQRFAAGTPFDGVVGTITDLNPGGGKAADFAATIAWGDGRTSAGRVRKVAAGKFEVVGTQTFASAGRRTVTVTIATPGGKTATAESIFTIDPPRAGRTAV